MKALPLVLISLVASLSSRHEQQPVFSTRTELVRIDVLVTDGRGSIAGLQAQDFEVFDNGMAQRIDRVLREDASLEAWLVLGSVRSQVGELEKAARTFLAQLTSRDRVGLLTFRHGVTLHFGLSPVPLSLEEFPEIRAEGYTSLRDAIAVALALRDKQMDRAMVLVLSDGMDTMSWLTETQLSTSVERSEAVIYSVATPEYQPRTSGARYLQRVADQTGGRVVRSENGTTLSATLHAVMAEMKSRYVLTYYPSGVATSGWHEVRVRLRTRGGKVRARRGYYAVDAPTGPKQ